jgi:hypothetical protein
MGDPAQYQDSSLSLYKAISGDADNDAARTGDAKCYFSFRPNQLDPTGQNQAVTSVKDPFGKSYGYSTVRASVPNGADGYNPTFDLWSTSGTASEATSPDQSQWIKNW